MIFGITASGGRRGQSNLDWRIKTIAFSLSSTISAGIAGAALGGVGGLLPAEARIGVGALAALVLAVVGLGYLTGWYHGMIQRNCETAQSWLERGALPWAVRNGAALGVGFMSRLGFVSWLPFRSPASSTATHYLGRFCLDVRCRSQPCSRGLAHGLLGRGGPGSFRGSLA